MDDALQSKLVEIIDKLQHVAVEGMKAAGKAAPQIVEYAIKLKFYDGLYHILLGVLFTVLFLVSGGILCKNWNRWWKQLSGDCNEALILFAAGGVLVLFVVACTQLLDIWVWVSVLDPKVALAHDILLRVLEKQ